MMLFRKSTGLLPFGSQRNSEWFELTPGERFTIRASAAETDGSFTMLELVADPRNGVLMHVHNGDTRLDARKSDDDIAVLADRFGCRIVGPTLHEGIYSISSPRA